MFEAALGQIEGRRGRLGTGAILSVAAHVLVVGIALYMPRSAPEARVEAPEVVFKQPLPLPPPPPPPGGKARTQKPDKPRPVRNKNVPVLAQTEPIKPAEPPPDEPEPSDGNDSDEPPGGGGEPGGVPGGVLGGTGIGNPPPPPPPPPPPAPSVLYFDAGSMDRPVLVSGPQPAYTTEARMARVEGVVVAQCTITTEGTLRDCRIIKGLPHLDAEVLTALAKQRYKPVLYRGQPANVRYVVTFRFRMQ